LCPRYLDVEQCLQAICTLFVSPNTPQSYPRRPVDNFYGSARASYSLARGQARSGSRTEEDNNNRAHAHARAPSPAAKTPLQGPRTPRNRTRPRRRRPRSYPPQPPGGGLPDPDPDPRARPRRRRPRSYPPQPPGGGLPDPGSRRPVNVEYGPETARPSGLTALRLTVPGRPAVPTRQAGPKTARTPCGRRWVVPGTPALGRGPGPAKPSDRRRHAKMAVKSLLYLYRTVTQSLR
jgi:hypothetical protein